MMIKHVLRLIINLLELPANPLDNLIHLCGGREVVAELTGRAVAMEVQPDGKFEQVCQTNSTPLRFGSSLSLSICCGEVQRIHVGAVFGSEVGTADVRSYPFPAAHNLAPSCKPWCR